MKQIRDIIFRSKKRRFLKDGRQTEVDFFQSWAVILPKFHADCLFKNKDTYKYKPGSVKAFKLIKKDPLPVGVRSADYCWITKASQARRANVA